MSPNKLSLAKLKNNREVVALIVETITKSAKLTWRARFLWLVGLVVALGQGSLVNTDLLTAFGIKIDPTNIQLFLKELASNFQSTAILLVVPLLALLLLSMAADAGLMKSILGQEQGKKTGFKETITRGFRYLVPLLKLLLVIFLILIGGVLLIFLPASAVVVASHGVARAAGIVGIAAFFALVLSVMLLLPFMMRFIVLSKTGVKESIVFSWQLMRRLPIKIAAIGLTGYVLQFLLSKVASTLVASLVAFPLAVLLSNQSSSSAGLSPFPFFVAGALALVVNAIVAVFINAYFTHAFANIVKEEVAKDA